MSNEHENELTDDTEKNGVAGFMQRAKQQSQSQSCIDGHDITRTGPFQAN